MKAEDIEQRADNTAETNAKLAHHIGVRLQIAVALLKTVYPKMSLTDDVDEEAGTRIQHAVWVAENLIASNQAAGVYWMAPSVQDSIDGLLEDEEVTEEEEEELWSAEEADDDDDEAE